MPRTLFVTFKMPYPLNSGTNQRVYHLLRALAGCGPITLVCFFSEERDRESLPALRSLCTEVHPVEQTDWGHASAYRGPRLQVWAHSFMEYLHPTVPVYMRWWESSAGGRLLAHLTRRPFDIVWAERIAALQVLPAGLGGRVIVDLDDLEYRKLGMRLRHGELYRRMPLDWIEYVKLRRFERGLTRRPYELLVCSEPDRARLGGGPRIRVVPNGVDLPALPDPAEEIPAEAPVFLFLGTMDYASNVDAVRFFASRILPLLRRRVPGARFLIVGRDPSPAVLSLHDGSSIVVTGTVPAVEPYLRGAAVVVAPIRFGGGTRIKILEAMAHRRPVVSTRTGVEGIEAEHERHLLVADAPEQFASSCERVWRDVGVRQRLVAAAEALVRTRYDWRRIEEQVRGFVRSRNAPGMA
jgi:glycosyltransferase involved in cell wall biosynthesis